LAIAASRSSLIGALLRVAVPSSRLPILNFLRGLSRDELECLAEFQGAWLIEAELAPPCNPYRMMADFFDPDLSASWQNPDVRAHRTFVVLAWLDLLRHDASARVSARDFHTGLTKTAV
jgi:hypothetical protein